MMGDFDVRAADADPGLRTNSKADRLAARHRPLSNDADAASGRFATSRGGSCHKFPVGATPMLPTIFHPPRRRNNDCPASVRTAAMISSAEHRGRGSTIRRATKIWSILCAGGAILARWDSMGGMNSRSAADLAPRVRLRAQRGMRRRAGVRCTGHRRAEPSRHRCDLQGVGVAALSAGHLGCHQRRNPRAAVIVQNFQHAP